MPGLHATKTENSVSFGATLLHLNPRLSPDAGFDALQLLLGGGIPELAAPTELVCVNPYLPWESQAVPCHPPVLTMDFCCEGFSGVVCVRGSASPMSVTFADYSRENACYVE